MLNRERSYFSLKIRLMSASSRFFFFHLKKFKTIIYLRLLLGIQVRDTDFEFMARFGLHCSYAQYLKIVTGIRVSDTLNIGTK